MDMERHTQASMMHNERAVPSKIERGQSAFALAGAFFDAGLALDDGAAFEDGAAFDEGFFVDAGAFFDEAGVFFDAALARGFAVLALVSDAAYKRCVSKTTPAVKTMSAPSWLVCASCSSSP